MTTTTGDPSSLKTPATLSGGDLVSRLLAATPPYLYNVPLTPPGFFFSEMLRSFVQAKAEASSCGSGLPPSRRRKRTWRDARDRPLELTTKERTHEKYFHVNSHSENRSKMESYMDSKNHGLGLDQKPTLGDVLKSSEESKSEFCKHKSYFDNHHGGTFSLEPTGSHDTPICSFTEPKVKPEQLTSDQNPFEDLSQTVNEASPFITDQKNKLEFPSRNYIPNVFNKADEIPNMKNHTLPNMPNSDFLPMPIWYPPYPIPPQSYPGIDPLHFFIDLRVSGHIWDRKLTERQLPFKSKHSSAFSVPQVKEYNRPLNLTRGEASSSENKGENLKGTHYILKNLTRTYKDIQEVGNTQTTTSECEVDGHKNTSEVDGSPKNEDEKEKKALRALIGLELVVDYVNEPKDNPVTITYQHPSSHSTE